MRALETSNVPLVLRAGKGEEALLLLVDGNPGKISEETSFQRVLMMMGAMSHHFEGWQRRRSPAAAGWQSLQSRLPAAHHRRQGHPLWTMLLRNHLARQRVQTHLRTTTTTRLKYCQIFADCLLQYYRIIVW